MKVSRLGLKRNSKVTIEESVDLSSYISEGDPVIKSIGPFICKATYALYDTLLHIDVELKGSLVLICSRSLEDIDYPLDIQDTLDFTDDPELSDDDVHYEPKNPIDLDPYLFGIVSSNVPMAPVKEGASLPPSGKGYRVLTEEELQKEREEEGKKNPFDSLKDLDLD